jgi:hypothetical protein
MLSEQVIHNSLHMPATSGKAGKLAAAASGQRTTRNKSSSTNRPQYRRTDEGRGQRSGCYAVSHVFFEP